MNPGINALQALPSELDYELRVVGRAEATYVSQLRARSSPEVWRRISFLQQVEISRLAEVLGETTVLIFPSRSENSPNAVKEAVVAGVPIVGSRVGSVPEYVRPGRNGVLVSPGDAPALTRGVRQEKLLNNPAKPRRTYSV